MNQACFAYRGETLPAGPNLSGRPQIFQKLAERGVSAVVSLGAEGAFSAEGLQVHDLNAEPDERLANERIASLESIGLIVNRLDRSIKMTELPSGIALPPLVNENATRSLAFRKHRVWSEVFAPLQIGIPTTLATSGHDIDQFLGAHAASEVIVKPDGGSNSQGVQRVNRTGLCEKFEDNPSLYGKNVLQPALDFTIPFPANLRAYDAANGEAFQGWSASAAVKELRMYGFFDPSQTALFPVARAIQGGDQWFFVDPDSVPHEVFDATERAISRAAKLTGAAALYGTVDYGYGTATDRDPAWHAIELNAKAPYMVGYDKHMEIADRLRDMLSTQIATTIQLTKE